MFSLWSKDKHTGKENKHKNKNSLFNLIKNIGLVNQKSKKKFDKTQEKIDI